MRTRSTLRTFVRGTVLTGAAFVLMGASGCDLIYRYVQCVLSGECTELVPELFSFPPAPPPPPQPSRDHASSAAVSAAGEFGSALAAPTQTPTTDTMVRLVVGAPGDDTGSGPTGSVYVYTGPFDEAQEPVRLVASDGHTGDRFGASVAVERWGTETVIVVGAPGSYPSGAAYVFERDGSSWTETARLRPGGMDLYTEFGTAVALVDAGVAGERVAVVGAPSGSDGGHVRVYRRTGGVWAADATSGHVPSFQPSGVTNDERFGASLASAGGFLAVGAPRRGGYAGAGAAYLFRHDPGTGAWTESPTRMEPEGSPSQAAFGTSVAVTLATGDTTPTVFVGAPGGGYSEEDGTVWAFLRGTDGTLARRRFADSLPGFGGAIAADPAVSAVAVGSPRGSADPTCASHVYAPVDLSRPLPVGAGRPIRGDGPWQSYYRFGAALVVRMEPVSGVPVIDVGAPNEGTSGVVYHFRLPEGTSDAKRAEPKPEGNRYMAFRADATHPGDGTAQVLVDRPLRTPFRAEVTVGSFAPSRREGLVGGSIALRVDRVGADPAQFATLRAGFRATGLAVSAENEYGTTGDAVEMPSEWAADLAIECDGSLMQLWARPRGTGEFEFVTNWPAGPGEFRASVVIEGIAAGSEVGMDQPRVLANASPPQDASPAETSVDLLYAALDREMAAAGAIDDRDLAAALAFADEAKAKLLEAKTAVAAIAPSKAKPPATGPKAALRQIGTAARELAKARALVKRGKRNAQILPKLSKSIDAVGRALAALR